MFLLRSRLWQEETAVQKAAGNREGDQCPFHPITGQIPQDGPALLVSRQETTETMGLKRARAKRN
jgi:hypothetical protein